MNDSFDVNSGIVPKVDTCWEVGNQANSGGVLTAYSPLTMDQTGRGAVEQSNPIERGQTRGQEVVSSLRCFNGWKRYN